MGFQSHFGISLFVFFAISFTHQVDSACALANIPNPFSWLLWLGTIIALVFLALVLIRWILIKYLYHNIAINLRLFK